MTSSRPLDCRPSLVDMQLSAGETKCLLHGARRFPVTQEPLRSSLGRRIGPGDRAVRTPIQAEDEA